MNYHYQKRFEPALRDGTKKHTIRGKAVPAGRVLKHIIYPYQRDKRECVLENVCQRTQDIEIVPSWVLPETKIYVEGRLLTQKEVQRLAWNDGFSRLVEFWLYFDEPFKGHIIHWTDLKY